MLCSRINKGKTPKVVSIALSDLEAFMAFHQSVSVAMGTALQHLADTSFVANLILLRRDAYLDHVKAGVKQDTWLHLHNAPSLVMACFLMMYFVRLSRILQSIPV